MQYPFGMILNAFPLDFGVLSFVGSIEIDGVDISTLRLEKLRKAIAIIPQEPVLFAGTIR